MKKELVLFESAEEAFAEKLEADEKLLWSGMREAKTTMKERGVKSTVVIGPSFVIGFAFGITVAFLTGGAPLGLIFTLPLMLLGVYIMRRVLDLGTYYYAVSSRRVFCYDGEDYYIMSLEKIRHVDVEVSKRDIGSVVFNRRTVEALHQDVAMGTTYEREVVRDNGGFYGIKAPQEVADILNKLIKKEEHWNF